MHGDLLQNFLIVMSLYLQLMHLHKKRSVCIIDYSGLWLLKETKLPRNELLIQVRRKWSVSKMKGDY